MAFGGWIGQQLDSGARSIGGALDKAGLGGITDAAETAGRVGVDVGKFTLGAVRPFGWGTLYGKGGWFGQEGPQHSGAQFGDVVSALVGMAYLGGADPSSLSSMFSSAGAPAAGAETAGTALAAPGSGAGAGFAGGYDAAGIAADAAGIGGSAGVPGAMTPAMIESAAGTPGYGASSVGAGGGPVGAGMSGLQTSVYDNMMRFGAPPELASIGSDIAGPVSTGLDYMKQYLGPNPLKTMGGALQTYSGATQLMASLERQRQQQQYARQLQALMRDPSSVSKLPGYEAGLQAVQRSMASQGYSGSGNMATALQKYGGDIYGQQIQRLAALQGADQGMAGIGAAGTQLGMGMQALWG